MGHGQACKPDLGPLKPHMLRNHHPPMLYAPLYRVRLVWSTSQKRVGLVQPNWFLSAATTRCGRMVGVGSLGCSRTRSSNQVEGSDQMNTARALSDEPQGEPVAKLGKTCCGGTQAGTWWGMAEAVGCVHVAV